MAEPAESRIRDQLSDRRSKLEHAREVSPDDDQLGRLLGEVDAAIERLDEGAYGRCETCCEPIEADRLIADPLVRFCLDHMTPAQRRALQDDLDLASKIQDALLPERGLRTAAWDVAYHYEGAGPISGDYCDLLASGDDLYFIVGDVSGKGVAASMLMAHLHASFRALASLNLPLEQIMARASRMFCESTLPTYFATLVCGKANGAGEVDICNAGHNPPLLMQGSKIKCMQATGLPLGVFCEESFPANKVRLDKGDTIVAYTDGLTEAVNTSGSEYGTERLCEVAGELRSLPPGDLIASIVEDLNAFRSGTEKADDLTLMAVRRMGRV
jgi:sigma-B regulation protein RsbU (phosphoserine phosphatase)